ncbi:MAG: AtpZ/AtpI family protein [Roseococcus sp.]|jgi:ATP synthase protein I
MVDERDAFSKRLAEARAKRGLDRPAGGKGQLPSGAWGIGFRAGVEVVSALIVGVGLGLLLDGWLGTWPWLFLVFFVLGAAAGVLNVYRLFNPRFGARKG